MKIRIPALLCVLLTAAACAKKAEQPRSAQTPAPVSTLLIESKGVTMPLGLAVRSLHFRPFIPSGQILQVAVIPPLNVDEQRNHGIAIEYAASSHALLLSQWPRAGAGITARPCAPVAYKADGLLWATRNGLVMTLQPDGTIDASRLAREARRLLLGGACGRAG